MEIVYGVDNLRKIKGRIIMAMGNFDGLHLAHQRIMKRTRDIALENGFKSVVFLLDPHPVKVLFPQKRLLLLSSLEERSEMLKYFQLDYLLIEKFTPEFAALSPYRFVRDYLSKKLDVAHLVVGFDYTFGKGGKGTVKHLLKWGDVFGFQVEVISAVMLNNEIVSSTKIRELLALGEVDKASCYLGYYFKRTSRVISGQGRGRQIGYPTANLDIPPDLLLPANGVYLTLVRWRNQKYFGLTNVGERPTFFSGDRVGGISVEVFLLDFDGNIYGEELTVYFLHRIREERAFQDASCLKNQIESDIRCGRELIEKKYYQLMEGDDLIPSGYPMFTKFS